MNGKATALAGSRGHGGQTIRNDRYINERLVKFLLRKKMGVQHRHFETMAMVEE
ncbi:MAG: hypothetical protein ABIL06_12970 [Pseudomonadota bacterium]